MYPVLFRIPGLDFPIRSFGVLVAVGIFVGIWLWGRLLERHGDDPENDPMRGSDVALWGVLGVFGGARVMYVIVEVARYLSSEITEPVRRALEGLPAGALSAAEIQVLDQVQTGYQFVHDPLTVFFIWKGGLVMYGGLIGGLALGILRARQVGLAIWNGLDTSLVAGFVGLAIGRWGCLLVGDDYGSLVPEEWTHLPFPLTIQVPSLEWLDAHRESLFGKHLAGQKAWATQVWMSLNALSISLVGWLLLRRRKRCGQAAAFMVMHYAVTRFLIEIFRGDEIRGLWFGDTVSTSQLVSIGGLLLGAYVFWRKPGPLAPEAAA